MSGAKYYKTFILFYFISLILVIALPADSKTKKRKKTRKVRPNFYSQANAEIDMQSVIVSDDNNENTKDYETYLTTDFKFLTKFRRGGLKYFSSSWQLFAKSYYENPDANRLFLKEGFISFESGRWKIRLGLQQYNLSLLEAFHPSDKLNARYFDFIETQYPKIGEPMLSMTYLFDESSLSLLWMPYNTSPLFLSSGERVSLSPLEVGKSIWGLKDQEKEERGGYGAIYDVNFGSLDIKLFYLNQYDKFYPFWVIESGQLRPIYRRVQQIALNFVYAFDDLLFKVESSHFDYDTPIVYNGTEIEQKKHTQYAVGLESTFVFNGGTSLTTYLEYQGIAGLEEETDKLFEVFQNDVFLAFRFDFNDKSSQQLLISWVKDMGQNKSGLYLEGSDQSIYSLEYSLRLGDKWKLELMGRYVSAPFDSGLTPVNLQNWHEDQQYKLSLKRYF